MRRRQFLCHAGALGAAATLAQLSLFSARAQAVSDYKALVCLFLYGGNDGNNTIVPLDAAGYASYATTRANLALPQASLLPLTESSGAVRFGLHPQLSALQSLWQASQLAIVQNVGTLLKPITKQQYQAGSVPAPANLFSHLDQQLQWQSSISDNLSNTGWGGRLCDQVASLNASSQVPAMISTAGNNLFVTGKAVQALTIPVSGTFGLQGFDASAGGQARLSALEQLLSLDRTDDLAAAAQDVMSGALKASTALNPVLTSTTSTAATYFSGLKTGIAYQLLAIARIIEAHAVLGARRQVFLATLGSFDTHTNELNTQQNLFGQLSPAIAAFQAALTAIGAASSVTTFTLTDFSRTYRPNTNGGTDHAWGNTAFVMGGAVKGGYYGTSPTLVLLGPDDGGAEGRWIPTTSVDQYAAALANWFGVDAAGLAQVLPNLSAFPAGPLGFI
jgi:uncharacterized protein (DUF1501 family)